MSRLILSLVLSLLLGAWNPVALLAATMDPVGTLSEDSQDYQKDVIKKVSATWSKICDNHWKFSFSAYVGMKADANGNLTPFTVYTSRNAAVDRLSLEACKKTNAGRPPATWNPEQIVYMYLNFKVANKKNLTTPGFPAVAQFREGERAAAGKLWDKAETCFSKAIQIDPMLAIAHVGLGTTCYNKNRVPEAIQSYKQALRLDPEDDELRFSLSKMCLQVHDVQDAKKIASEVNSISKYYSRAQDLIADRGEFANGATGMESAASSTSNTSSTNTANTDISAPAIYNKGVTEARSGNYLEAIKLYKKTIELEPDHPLVYSALGSAYISLNQITEAESALKKGLTISPNDDDAKYMLASVYITLNRQAEALPILKSIKPGASGYSLAQEYIKKFTSSASGQVPATQTNRPNQTTVESVVTGEGNSVVKDKWALVIGISKFANPEYNLKFAAKDAQDFYNYLITEGNFKKDHVLLLLNENATRRNIMSAFGDKFLPAVCREGDLVTIYISTHGTPASKDPGQRNFIIAYDTESDALYETGVDMDELYRRVKEGVKTERALIVMDTCYSGAGVPGARGVDAGANFDADLLAQGSGHLVMTSSSPSERSWESKVTPNGVFTKYLIQNLKLTKGNVKNSFDKLKDDVGWEVQNAFNQQQHPQIGGQWQGKEMILNAIPTNPRPVLNPDLLKLMNLSNAPKPAVKK
ncbi:MAG: tetratricopeptide repeat protein [Cyanobacteria bacterium TGS_CYA1]|nr:tetratricopeptide repeat protein [Cyanobacteria bacterium TGS_CYA1]